MPGYLNGAGSIGRKSYFRPPGNMQELADQEGWATLTGNVNDAYFSYNAVPTIEHWSTYTPTNTAAMGYVGSPRMKGWGWPNNGSVILNRYHNGGSQTSYYVDRYYGSPAIGEGSSFVIWLKWEPGHDHRVFIWGNSSSATGSNYTQFEWKPSTTAGSPAQVYLQRVPGPTVWTGNTGINSNFGMGVDCNDRMVLYVAQSLNLDGTNYQHTFWANGLIIDQRTTTSSGLAGGRRWNIRLINNMGPGSGTVRDQMYVTDMMYLNTYHLTPGDIATINALQLPYGGPA
jgi:hypothetical protein